MKKSTKFNKKVLNIIKVLKSVGFVSWKVIFNSSGTVEVAWKLMKLTKHMQYCSQRQHFIRHEKYCMKISVEETINVAFIKRRKYLDSVPMDLLG